MDAHFSVLGRLFWISARFDMAKGPVVSFAEVVLVSSCFLLWFILLWWATHPISTMAMAVRDCLPPQTVVELKIEVQFQTFGLFTNTMKLANVLIVVLLCLLFMVPLLVLSHLGLALTLLMCGCSLYRLRFDG